MGGSKWNAFLYQIVGKLRRIQIANCRGVAGAFFIDNGIFDHDRGGTQRDLDGIDRIKNSFLVLLHVLVVRERQALHHREERHIVAENTARFAAKQF